MPPKGYKKPPSLTAEDYATGGELCAYAANILAVVARKHPDVPMLLAAITLANQSSEQLYERRNQADLRQPTSVVLPDGDRPGEDRA